MFRSSNICSINTTEMKQKKKKKILASTLTMCLHYLPNKLLKKQTLTKKILSISK